mmetsp:Transcript_5306/g.15849  ORF Transcript_5306/g.15849 Transcript_5306/m.15849 type:complete len:92 (+) Transcript_5306:123-398(+)
MDAIRGVSKALKSTFSGKKEVDALWNEEELCENLNSTYSGKESSVWLSASMCDLHRDSYLDFAVPSKKDRRRKWFGGSTLRRSSLQQGGWL